MFELLMLLAVAAAGAVYTVLFLRTRKRKSREAREAPPADDVDSPIRVAQQLLDDAESALNAGDQLGALRAIDDACLMAPEDPMVQRRAEVLRSRVA